MNSSLIGSKRWPRGNAVAFKSEMDKSPRGLNQRMNQMIESSRLDVTAWLDQLAARGISAHVENNRVRFSPTSASRRLTHVDLSFVNQHRIAIIRVLERRISYLEVRP
jgi:hypothetical protein